LIQHTKESYGDSFDSVLFEQYKHYVESAEKISERRVSANNYLLTVNAFLVTLYSLVAASRFSTYWIVLVPVAGFLVSLTWYRIITSYRDLNTVKFKVIHELEQHMPAELYRYEWKKAEEGRGKTYHPLSHLERWIPIVFIVLYVLLAIVGSFGKAS
jgi:carbon starvation protein CstA